MTTPRGIRNNNPGNIRKSPEKWRGEIEGQDSAFETFDTPENGIRAIAKILLSYQNKRGLRTIVQLIGRWAPPVENDTDSYAEHVADNVRVLVDQPVDLSDQRLMVAIVTSIIRHENGVQPYMNAVIEDGVRRAYA
jgi:hypothetical protein